MSQFSYTIGIFLFVGFLIPIVFLILLGTSYRKAIRRNTVKSLIVFAIVSLLANALISLGSVYTVIRIVPMLGLLCLYLPGVIGLVLVVSDQPRDGGTYSINVRRAITFAQIALIGSFVAIPLMSFGIARICDSYHRQLALPIIQGITSFEQNKKYTPPDSYMLVPDYLEKIPTPICLLPYDWTNGKRLQRAIFYTVECESENHFVAVMSTDLNSIQAYDFSTNSWSKVYSFDSSCHSPLFVSPLD
ncbi:MAG: hypothetical protein ACOYZ6_19340 [Chloroflexota bacterium]